ncbi:MAG: hypothetical protein HY824_17515 [Acidobacteria bacterium]|nr:hypothetical protein [Acidobacteriota bacterium]
MNRSGGFTTIELLMAAAITLTVTAALVDLARRAEGSVQAQPEHADMHQRLRAAVDALTRDLAMAGAGLQDSTVPPVVPYRVGGLSSDIDGGVLYRPDTVSVSYVPWGASAIESHTYYLKTDATTKVSSLMHYDGEVTDLAVVDNVVQLEFEYDGEDGGPIDPAALHDGPWLPDDPAAVVTFDADLLRIRRVRVVIGVEAALPSMRGRSPVFFVRGGASTSMERYLPDERLRVDVALRNARVGE